MSEADVDEALAVIARACRGAKSKAQPTATPKFANRHAQDDDEVPDYIRSLVDSPKEKRPAPKKRVSVEFIRRGAKSPAGQKAPGAGEKKEENHGTQGT